MSASIFINNKYTRIYYMIVERAKDRSINGYTETHHIIPKSLGGSDRNNNLVDLTAREHFICHRLLTKMTTGNGFYKMTNAIHRMSNPKSATKFTPNGRTYQYIREQRSLSQTGKKNHFYGKKHSEETRAIISAKVKGLKNHCVPHTVEAKAKIAAGLFKGKCPHCGKEGKGNLMKRWHFDNCKHRGD